MSGLPERLSVPPPARPPRPLTEAEQARYVAVADALCRGDQRVPPPSGCTEFPRRLHLALALRAEAFDAIVRALAAVPGTAEELEPWLRRLHDEDPAMFAALSTVAAGAYLLEPAVRAALGYPGQHPDPPAPDEALREIGDGILDPVRRRGPRYRLPPDGV
ncbi:hypothetical protein [Rhizomonospora bruguierae]|uniref:hypothetical protein n=1 Tax=Rhizomonospora bruguierae TaxID=1581705 RepID=UPI001BCBAFB6|nr:hypothetical protein [Micromonospora sp. NBRC 107566]